MVDPKRLLEAALAGELSRLSVEVGESAPALARQAVRMLNDPAVVAAFPIECRMLTERLERQRRARSRRRLSVRITV